MSHYKYLEKHLVSFFKELFKEKFNEFAHNNGAILAHGDKCYQYRDEWKEKGIPFNHGVLIYLLSYYYPFSTECRQTDFGWVAPVDWVANNYLKYLPIIQKIENELAK